MYEEEFLDAEGRPFTATREFFEQLRDNYNSYLRTSIPEKVLGIIRKVAGKNISPRYAPVITDHDPSNAMNKKGYVTSLFIEEADGMSVLFANVIITDPVTIKKLKEGCLKEVSVGFSFDDNEEPELREMSLVVRGAVAGAMFLMSKYKKNKRKEKMSSLTKSFKDSMEEVYRKIAIQEMELKELKKLKHEGVKTSKVLSELVKKGCISLAAKKAIYHKLSDSDRKTQNIVFDVLQTNYRYGTVDKGHKANITNAMHFEEYIKANSRGKNMSVTKESDTLVGAVQNELKPNTSSVSEVETQNLLKQFNEALKGINVLQGEIKRLKTQDKEREATFTEVLTFMKKGKFKKAVRLASEYSTPETEEFSEDWEDEDDEEITGKQKSLKKLKESTKNRVMSFLSNLMEASEEHEFGKGGDTDVKDSTKKTQMKRKEDYAEKDDDKKMKEDKDEYCGDKKKMKEDDDDDDDKKKMKEDDDDDDDKKKMRKKKMRSKKMKEDDDDDE